MKRIPLTQGKFALIDDSDFELINQFKWRAQDNRYTFYAVRHVLLPNSGRRSTILMHRVILNAPKGYDSDHVNGEGLDNRRDNLRIATRSQNNWNRQPNLRGTSKFKGVCWHKCKEKWQAQIGDQGKDIYLGSFESEIEAALAYDAAALKYFGAFSKLNFPAEVTKC